MQRVIEKGDFRVPIKSWCDEIEDGALQQAADLAKHPSVFHHVSLMPDCHQGYGMPIGGVVACENTLIPNAVGVDIGCGMGAAKSNITVDCVSQKKLCRIVTRVKELIPCGEGKAHKKAQNWRDFSADIRHDTGKGWLTDHVRDLVHRNLGTLGGGNHFIEIQTDEAGFVWLMIHTGSRHLGNMIARFYNETAIKLNHRQHREIPNQDLAYLPSDSTEGKNYVRDMNFALQYATENRRRIMDRFQSAFKSVFTHSDFENAINIHHNYAALERHYGKEVWVHRKGATSAKKGEIGIIPGSMGAPSYIVQGLGNRDSFLSCSHGAGRKMGRRHASRALTVKECTLAMEGIVFDGWKRTRRGKDKGKYDLGEAPQAYKNIDAVINFQKDLVKPLVRLKPLAVIKG